MYSDLKFLQEQGEIVRAELAENAADLHQAGRGVVHPEFTPPNCGFGENGHARIVFDFEAVRFGLVPLAAAVAIAAFSLTPAETEESARRLAEMSAELRSTYPAVSPAPALLVPLLRLACLDAAWRQLDKRRADPARGWGYLKEDVKNLRWLNENEVLIMQHQRPPGGGG